MTIRANFESELEKLKNLLLTMGTLTEEALHNAIVALTKQDLVLALEVMEKDDHIDQLEDEINDLALLIIIKQAPVATDLRRIIAALKISNDIERIADNAVNIAKATIRIGEKDFIKPIIDIPKMAQLTQSMLSDSIQAYLKRDIHLAREVINTDEKVDALYEAIIRELIIIMSQDKDSIKQGTQLSMICRFLERAGDHCKNISESIVYLVKGKRYNFHD